MADDNVFYVALLVVAIEETNIDLTMPEFLWSVDRLADVEDNVCVGVEESETLICRANPEKGRIRVEAD